MYMYVYYLYTYVYAIHIYCSLKDQKGVLRQYISILGLGILSIIYTAMDIYIIHDTHKYCHSHTESLELM